MEKTLGMLKEEAAYNAPNYHPLPVVFSKADGVHVWDPEGKKYYDFLAAYGAVNQGHCHPKIKAAMIEQLDRCTISSRAFYNDKLGEYSKYICETLGYEMMLPMNSGAEAVETAIKLARKWAYMKKGVSEDKATIITCSGNFHGRTTTIISFSVDPVAHDNFGPFTPGFLTIDYDDLNALEKCLKEHSDHTAAFLVEPIQGEAGVKVPSEGYLAKAKALCEKYNTLMIADEIQTGIGRTGKLLCVEWDNVKPDMALLGKALSGGFYPVSAVVGRREVLNCIQPGEHGSTFGGNPLGCVVGMAGVKVLLEEDMVENSRKLGEIFREKIRSKKSPFIKDVRGKGLMNAVEIVEGGFGGGKQAYDLCLLLASKGMLCKPTHETTIRLTPPLTMTEDQLNECAQILCDALDEIQKLELKDIPRKGL